MQAHCTPSEQPDEKSKKPKKSALKHDLFAQEAHQRKVETLSADESHMQFSALTAQLDQIAPRPQLLMGGRPDWRYVTSASFRQ
jgi:hypothetical protein